MKLLFVPVSLQCLNCSPLFRRPASAWGSQRRTPKQTPEWTQASGPAAPPTPSLCCSRPSPAWRPGQPSHRSRGPPRGLVRLCWLWGGTDLGGLFPGCVGLEGLWGVVRQRRGRGSDPAGRACLFSTQASDSECPCMQGCGPQGETHGAPWPVYSGQSLGGSDWRAGPQTGKACAALCSLRIRGRVWCAG